MSAQGLPASWREDLVCSIFAQVLRRDVVAADADFFRSGGDSLRATLALVQIRQWLDAGFSTRAFFELKTAQRVAAAVASDARGEDEEDEALRAAVPRSVQAEPVRLAAAAPVPWRAAAVAAPSDLASSVREHARVAGVSPGVVYLSAWLGTLRSADEPAEAIVVLAGEAPASEAGVWVRSPETLPCALERRALQHALLDATRRPPRALLRCSSLLRYGAAAAAAAPAPPIEGSSWGLDVIDGEQTRLRLGSLHEGPVRPHPERLLELYLERLNRSLDEGAETPLEVAV